MSAIDMAAASVLARRALDIAMKVAGKGAEVKVDVHRDVPANVRFARNAITTSGSADETTVSIWVKLGKRHAAASINQATDDAIKALAERAVTMAKLSPEDPESMPLLPFQEYRQAPSAYDGAVATMDATARAAVAGRACALGDKTDTWIAGLAERRAAAHVIKTSSGIDAFHRETSFSYSTTARTKDGTGSGWAGREGWRSTDLDDVAISQTAIDKARASASPKPLAPGKYTVVLEPAAVQEMLTFLVGSMDQRSADEGRSFFAGKVGEKLFPDAITLKSDPGSTETPGSMFDGEGLRLEPQSWIEAGRVKQLEMSRFWAAKQAKEPTGDQSVFHLAGGNAASIDDLVKGTKRGLLVTRFWYTRMLEPQTVMLTGLTRDGVFLIENGKITQPVQNFRYNESPVNVLKNVEAMTRETFRLRGWGGVWKVPALRTNEFTMASVSAAV
jgi:predicted Zn-dependent protease